MPDKTPRYIYWDANVFIDHISVTPGRAEEIRRVWNELVKDKENRIVTATLSIVEVAHINEEKARGRLDATATSRLDAMWNDSSLLLVEMPQYLLLKARDLMRDATSRGWSLQAGDAMHLAAAMWVHQQMNPISEFQTYDDRLFKYAALTEFPINVPHVTSPQQTHFLDKDKSENQ